jgi:hypothetical protein
MKTMLTHWGRATAVLALLAFLPLATSGCFGRFQLTRNLYQFNVDVSPDKWVRWFVFLVLAIVPIYFIAAVVDLVFANSVEFWSGKNPIVASTHTFYGEDGQLARVHFNTDRTVDIVVIDAKGRVQEITVAREGDALAARDKQGLLLARVSDVNGLPEIVQGSLR